MEWYAIDKDYVKYLKKYDRFVPNIEYKNRMKCFLGIILNMNGFDYFAPVTSYKPKFDYMKNDLDFFKIYDRSKNKIYGAIDINNMLPVLPNNYIKLSLDNLSRFRTFNNNREKISYWKLLQKEAFLLNEKELLSNAERVYYLKKYYPENNIAKRCCDFEKLEAKCIEYKKINKELVSIVSK